MKISRVIQMWLKHEEVSVIYSADEIKSSSEMASGC